MDWYQDLMAIDWEATADFILDKTIIIGENETPTSPDVTTTDPVSIETAEPATGSEITTTDAVPTDAVTSSETETTSVSTAAEADSTSEETTTGTPGAIECSTDLGK